jgi:hypothetical protein
MCFYPNSSQQSNNPTHTLRITFFSGIVYVRGHEQFYQLYLDVRPSEHYSRHSQSALGLESRRSRVSGGAAQVARSCSRGISSAGPSKPIENSARDAHLWGVITFASKVSDESWMIMSIPYILSEHGLG